MQLNEWVDNNKPDPNLFYAEEFYRQIEGVRKATWCLFSSADERRTALRVVGTHMSKSVLLPVYSLRTRGVDVSLRCNFYNYKVSVRSDMSIDGLDDLDLFNPLEEHASVYCEGMSEVYGAYATSHKQFTVEIYGYGDLHAFFRLLNKRIPSKVEGSVLCGGE